MTKKKRITIVEINRRLTRNDRQFDFVVSQSDKLHERLISLSFPQNAAPGVRREIKQTEQKLKDNKVRENKIVDEYNELLQMRRNRSNVFGS